MPYTQIPNFKRMLTLGVLAIASLTPVLAHAQFQINKLYGRSYPEVAKMLGKPVEVTKGTPIIYSRFNTPGAVDTIVWYFWNTGQVAKVQALVLAKPGEGAADCEKVLKRYGLSIGPNPRAYQVVPPGRSIVSVGAVPGMPWTKVAVSYEYVIPFQQSLMKYCRDHHLDSTKTFFYTIQVSNKPPSRDRMMGAGNDTGGGAKGGTKKGKGKGKKG
jgi:hypothetical protein